MFAYNTVLVPLSYSKARPCDLTYTKMKQRWTNGLCFSIVLRRMTLMSSSVLLGGKEL